MTAEAAAERSATFAGEMATIPGAAKMEMRIDVLERMPGEVAFHVISAPGLGVWRSSAPGVKNYKYLKQVTNLAAPAYYRAAVRFRWLNAKGRLVKSAELRTRVRQPPRRAGNDAAETARRSRPRRSQLRRRRRPLPRPPTGGAASGAQAR